MVVVDSLTSQLLDLCMQTVPFYLLIVVQAVPYPELIPYFRVVFYTPIPTFLVFFILPGIQGDLCWYWRGDSSPNPLL